MKSKAIDCLKLVDTHEEPFEVWKAKYTEICEKYSEKAVIKKLDELVERGYIECGVSARMGWLTDKGKEILDTVNKPITATECNESMDKLRADIAEMVDMEQLADMIIPKHVETMTSQMMKRELKGGNDAKS